MKELSFLFGMMMVQCLLFFFFYLNLFEIQAEKFRMK